MTLPLYQIVGWNDYFENAKSRTYDRCQYVVSPNKHGGSGWSNVMGEPDGRAIWGIWKMLLDICSRQRKPREGWLTADGTRTGRRLTERELSHQLRCSIEEINRALEILQSPEVAFIRLVEGQRETLESIADGYSKDTTRPGTDRELISAEYPPPVAAQDTAVSVEYPQGVSARDTESKKESKKHSPSKGGPEGEEQAGTSGIADRHSEDTSRIPAGRETDTAPNPTEEPLEDVVQHAEAKLVLGKLARDVFPDEEPGAIWKNNLDYELGEVLPLKREVLEYVDWAYRLPSSHRLFQDKGGGGMMRRRSFATLIPNLKSEASKIRDARKKIGLNGLREIADCRLQIADCEWTPARRAAAIELYGSDRELPEQFSGMPASCQAEIEKKAGENVQRSTSTAQRPMEMEKA